MQTVITIERTEVFDNWLASMADVSVRARIVLRIRRAGLGNFGDCKALGGGVSEMRIDEGPGYRVYFARAGTAVYLLLCGGDKSRQQMDIQRARALWALINKGESCVRLPSRASMPRTI
jgi:putative addiction module killer protein